MPSKKHLPKRTHRFPRLTKEEQLRLDQLERGDAKDFIDFDPTAAKKRFEKAQRKKS